jgi:alkanesulfonate monooxygenase SsuD/methylene tetrahydromethanopterin reductase-like flavin-dependent oxidoreductase (luciferase family)
MELRVLTLGDWGAGPAGAPQRTQPERFQQILALGERAEELGFDGFHIGEHHFCDYIVSNPVPLLAAIAARTSRIKLSTGVTLLANRDPALVAEDYATLDLISSGRAELVAGRGNAFFECYRQMGHDIGQSREMFEENLDLLIALWAEGPVTWKGRTRPPLDQARVQPRPYGARPAIWIGGGSSEDSIRAAAERKLDLQLPGVFAGAPHFAGLARLYRELHPKGRIGFTAHIHVRESGEDARRVWAPYHLAYLDWVWGMIHEGARGAMPKPPPATAERAYLDTANSPALCGSPTEIAARILAWDKALGGIDVLLLKFDGGNLPDADIDLSMRLVASEVRSQVEDGLRATV